MGDHVFIWEARKEKMSIRGQIEQAAAMVGHVLKRNSVPTPCLSTTHRLPCKIKLLFLLQKG